MYWDEVLAWAPLIGMQIVVAYGLEMLLSWTRHRIWHCGFGPIPIVLSTNLFLWFLPEYFYLQFVLIVLSYLSREFIRWERDGRSGHIFNPSGFSLALVATILLFTGSVQCTRGVDIVGSFEIPPNFIEVIFLLGLVVQLLFGTTPVTMGAVFALYVLFHVSWSIVGSPLGPVPMEPSVFLGATFLITDPSSSPQTKSGKFLAGVTYGAGVFAFCILLRMIDQPSFVDKVLMVPIVNLMVPFLDRVGRRIDSLVNPRNWLSAVRGERFLWVGCYLGLMLLVLQSQKYPTIGEAVLPPPVVRLSDDVYDIWKHIPSCREKFPGAFVPFGFIGEYQSFQEIQHCFRNGERPPGRDD